MNPYREHRRTEPAPAAVDRGWECRNQRARLARRLPGSPMLRLQSKTVAHQRYHGPSLEIGWTPSILCVPRGVAAVFLPGRVPGRGPARLRRVSLTVG